MEHLYCVVVMHTWKWRDNSFKLCRITFKDLQFLLAIFKNSSCNVRKKPLRQGHNVIKRCVSHFRLDHPKLSEMPPRLRLFRAKGRTKTVSLAKSRGSRFVVKLP